MKTTLSDSETKGRRLLALTAVVSVVALLAVAGTVEAQPEEEFNVTFPGEVGSGAESVVETSNGRFAVAGFERRFVRGDRDVLFTRTSRDGREIHRRTFGGSGLEGASSVVETSDDGYAIAGQKKLGFSRGNKAWLIRTDVVGKRVSDRTFSGGQFAVANSLVRAPDGGLALTGRSRLPGTGSDAWLIRTDGDGRVLFRETFGGSDRNGAFSDIEVWRGGFALAGWKRPSDSASTDAWLVRTDRNGIRRLSDTFGGQGLDRVESVAETSDRGVVMAGRTESFGTGNSSDVWLVKTDKEGNEVFNRTFGGEGFDRAFSVVETSDGGYAVAGETESFGSGNRDAWLIKTNEEGDEEFSMAFGGADRDTAKSVTETSDGGLALAGSTESFGSGNRDAWLIKLAGSEPKDEGRLAGDRTEGSEDVALSERGDGSGDVGPTGDAEDGSEPTPTEDKKGGGDGTTDGTQNAEGSEPETEGNQETEEESDVEDVSMPGFTVLATIVAMLLLLAARVRRA